MESPAVYIASSDGPLRQGEIISGMVAVRLKLLPNGRVPQQGDLVEFQPISHPFAIVLSQDCELDWDFKARRGIAVSGKVVAVDKLIPNVLFAEVTAAEELRGGHGITSDIWKRIRQNKDERYQFLERTPADCDSQQMGLPELGVDFKRYFTVPTDEVYARVAIGEAQRRCRLTAPYLQHLSTRFFHFQNRVALPREHESEPVQG